MRNVIRLAAAGLVLSVGFVKPAVAVQCPDDSVVSGAACIDKYEASLWFVPPQQESLIDRIQKGKVTHADLAAAGAVQLGLVFGDLDGYGCPVNGHGCANVYAVSIPGVIPAGNSSWFQVVAALRNSLKRLPSSEEWLAAAMGTPDSLLCNVGPASDTNQEGSSARMDTGSNPSCVSDVGALDMVGNLFERVADWGIVQGPATCITQFAPFYGGDILCSGGPTMIRGGFFGTYALGGGTRAGVFALRGNFNPDFAPPSIGFRGVR